MDRDLASMPARPDGRDDGGSTTDATRDRRHLIVAFLALFIGVVVLVVSVGSGNVLSIESLVGMLFLAIAVVRYRLAQGG
ncbi:MAG: hypothetical protein OXH97_10220 [Chloroflexota bacterium]|nr:hypothetical protein [Chloroflexota bacterium]